MIVDMELQQLETTKVYQKMLVHNEVRSLMYTNGIGRAHQ